MPPMLLDRRKVCLDIPNIGQQPLLYSTLRARGQSNAKPQMIPKSSGTGPLHGGSWQGPSTAFTSTGCHALYLTSVSVETLSGALAVRKAISTTFERDVLPTPTVVHFKVTEQGITLTDVQRK